MLFKECLLNAMLTCQTFAEGNSFKLRVMSPNTKLMSLSEFNISPPGIGRAIFKVELG